MTKTELQTRLEQCRQDKAAIEAEEKKLLAEIERQAEVPIISWGTFEHLNDRVIINLTPDMIRRIKNTDTKQLVIDSGGQVGRHIHSHKKRSGLYSNITPIFGSFVPKED